MMLTGAEGVEEDMMRNIKMVIEYDGSRYNGFQRLGDTDNTIQFKIENVLQLMTGEKRLEIVGSGRTDAGVHALNQVVNFLTRTQMSPEAIRDYCNRYLPDDIVVKSAEEVDERFHARYNAKSKKYLYRIWNHRIPTAFHRKYTTYVPEKLNLAAMRTAAQYFIGEHDFKAFTTAKSKKKSTVKEIFSIEITKEDARLDIMIHGDGFLHNMVRIIVGTLLEVGQGRRKPDEVIEIIEGKVRAEAGNTAPPEGLFLYEVYYE